MSFSELKKTIDSLDQKFLERNNLFLGWQSWSIVRCYFWYQLFYQNSIQTAKKYFFKKLYDIVKKIFFGVLHNLTFKISNQQPVILLLTNRREVLCPDGIAREFQFDDFLFQQGKKYQVIEIRYPWKLEKKTSKKNYFDAAPRILSSQIFSRIAKYFFYRSAQPLAEQMPEYKNFFAMQLAAFYFNYVLFKRFLKKINCVLMFLPDGNGKMAEIAAAKNLKIPVVEMQHGIFGADDPTANWPSSYGALKPHLPIADYFFVYGEFWQTLLARNGFWDKDHIKLIGLPMIDRFKKECAQLPSTPFIILYASQGVVRKQAIEFFHNFLSLIKEKNSLVQLHIKLHPQEKHCAEDYQKLKAQFPTYVFIIDVEPFIYHFIINAHLVLSYHSTTLIESVALAKPTVSICDGPAKKGFAEIALIPDIEHIMPHIYQPIELFNIVHACLSEKDFYPNWQTQTQIFGANIFTSNFLHNIISETESILGEVV